MPKKEIMKVLSHLLIMISLIFLFLPVSALAKEKILKRDRMER